MDLLRRRVYLIAAVGRGESKDLAGSTGGVARECAPHFPKAVQVSRAEGVYLFDEIAQIEAEVDALVNDVEVSFATKGKSFSFKRVSPILVTATLLNARVQPLTPPLNKLTHACSYGGASTSGQRNDHRCLGHRCQVTHSVDTREVDQSPASPYSWCRKELAHIRCDHASGVRLGESLHRGRKETEAESVAHLCCRALGLDTQVYSDAYVLGCSSTGSFPTVGYLSPSGLQFAA
jgi:hypothetical protein